MMIDPIGIPGLFVTGTDTDIGKTLITGAIADYFCRKGKTVAVSKPLASGCEKQRDQLVSRDAEFLASCADSRFPLDLINPVRFAEPLAPAMAAERAGMAVDWPAIDRAFKWMTQPTELPVPDLILVEGVGGVMVPLDEEHTVIDLARWLKLPAIVVARSDLGTLNHTILTVKALERAGVAVAGVVVNRYPAQTASIAQENNPRYIEKWTGIPVLAIVPEAVGEALFPIPRDIRIAIERVEWEFHLSRPRLLG